jgi:muramoyltetrapeptide carboxypeptidase
MLHPPFLHTASTIAIASTARFAEESIIEESKNILTHSGFKVLIAPNVTTPHFRFAGDDDARAKALQDLLDDPSVNAIWFARGGYGTLRIIDKLRWDGFLKHPKWLIGFSDMTLLHLKLRQLGYCSIHGCTISHLVKYGASHENVITAIRALKGEALHYEFPSSAYNKTGQAKGIIAGGNLSMIVNSIGTDLQPDFNNCILFLEDIDEYLYHYERMLLQLRRSGLLKGIKGLIFGRSTVTPEHDDIEFGFRLGEIVHLATEGLNIPIAFNAPFGHTEENFALCLGREINLSVDESTVVIR